jgi:hypothetical protein
MSELLDVSQVVNSLRSARSAKELTPRVYHLDGDATELAPPGSLTVLFGVKGSLDRIEEAIAAGDVDRINEVASESNKAIQGYRRGIGSLSNALVESSSFVDVSYGGRTLASALTADDRTFTRVIHPYLGGGVENEQFSVAEFFDESRAGQELDVVVVVHEPKIDDVTRGVLERIGVDETEIRVGVDPNLVACTVTATPVVVAVTVAIVATAATSCASSWNDREWYTDPDPIIGELAPRLAVERLLAIRANDFAKPSR